MGEKNYASSTGSSYDVIKRRRKRRKKIIGRIFTSILAVLLLISVIVNAVLAFSWTALNEKNRTYKETYASQNAEMGELKTKVAEANNLLSSIQKQLEELSEENASMKQRIADLEAENEDLKGKMSQTGTGTGNGDGTSGEAEQTVKKAYLTFDDGCSVNTPTILDILDRYGVKATFFVNWKSKYKDYYQLIVEKGHALGNHTATHEWDTVYSTLDGFVDEVQTLSDKVYDLTGYKMTLFRFPGGTNNTINQKHNSETSFCTMAAEKISEMGYIYFDGNVDSRDADGKTHTADEIASNVLSGAKNKTTAIILMHDTGTNKQSTVDALPEIIEGLLEMGFEIEALSSSSKLIQFKPATRKS